MSIWFIRVFHRVWYGKLSCWFTIIFVKFSFVAMGRNYNWGVFFSLLKKLTLQLWCFFNMFLVFNSFGNWTQTWVGHLGVRREKKHTHKKRTFVSIIGGVLFFFFSLFHFIFFPFLSQHQQKKNKKATPTRGGVCLPLHLFVFCHWLCKLRNVATIWRREVKEWEVNEW